MDFLSDEVCQVAEGSEVTSQLLSDERILIGVDVGECFDEKIDFEK